MSPLTVIFQRQGAQRKHQWGGFKVFATIYPDFVVVLLPAALVAVKLTVYFPAAEYVCTGYLTVEDVLSPKFHFLQWAILYLCQQM
jgi:hypothetical protein